MIKACIFDLDGTLLDTLSTITYYVNRTLVKYGCDPINEDECKRIVGDGAAVLIERAFMLRGVTDREVVTEALRYYKPDYDSDPLYLTKPYEDIAEMLSSLRGKGIRLAVLSNKPDTAVVGIIEHFLPDTFEVVRGGRDGVALKPDPTAALEVAALMGVSALECAFIGDTGVDMRTGVNMGAALKIGVSWGFRPISDITEGGSDVVVDRPAEIVAEVMSRA